MRMAAFTMLDISQKGEKWQKAQCSFLKKRTKKLLSVCHAATIGVPLVHSVSMRGFFASFFPKKEDLAYLIFTLL
jgi:hypothetical protein